MPKFGRVALKMRWSEAHTFTVRQVTGWAALQSLPKAKPPEGKDTTTDEKAIRHSRVSGSSSSVCRDPQLRSIDGGHVASRYISVKPKSANVTTDVHIVSDHGNEYTLQLREVSDDADAHFDSKVMLEPGDQTAKDKLASVPVFVPAAAA